MPEHTAEHTCSICGRSYYGYGNNAKPVNDGRCCNDCNAMVVVPTRIASLYGTSKPAAPKTEEK